MSKVKFEIRTVTGSYTDKNGSEKKRYQTIGSVIETGKGLMAKIESVPVVEGGWSGWCYLNEPRPKEESDIPF